MTERQDLIVWSLELAGERAGDLTERVYALLFARHPEFERLFVLDRQGAVRGSMLANALEAVLDMAGARRYGLSLVTSERAAHEAYGVPRQDYASFFGALRDAVREAVGADWTDAAETAWSALLQEIDAAVARS